MLRALRSNYWTPNAIGNRRGTDAIRMTNFDSINLHAAKHADDYQILFAKTVCARQSRQMRRYRARENQDALLSSYVMTITLRISLCEVSSSCQNFFSFVSHMRN